MKILLVEDDKTIASGLEYSLQQDHFATVHCLDVESAKKVLAEELNQFALCLFDLSLPDGSGYELCRIVKERSDMPVIFLTAIDDEVNVVMGLDMGADDYITKPFGIRELLSRIKSVFWLKLNPNGNMDICKGCGLFSAVEYRYFAKTLRGLMQVIFSYCLLKKLLSSSSVVTLTFLASCFKYAKQLCATGLLRQLISIVISCLRYTFL